jgi:adenylate/nucleoside-diphosphate kinase
MKLREEMKREGRGIEEMMINLLRKRIQQRDCLERGWVLEDFPKTKFHAD